MPINPTYPGVYIEELENPVRTIVGVSTSVTAFIGRALKGPDNEPTMIHNFGDFERIFGGLWKGSTMSYAVYQYFLNGGKDALIGRVIHTDTANPDQSDKPAKFARAGDIQFLANSPGSWANTLRINIDREVDETQPDSAELFNLKVSKVIKDDGEETELVELELFRNLSVKSEHKRYVYQVLLEESRYIEMDSGPAGDISVPPAGTYNITEQGKDGIGINSTDILGVQADKTGIYSLEKADIFNLMCIPPPSQDGAASSDAHYTSVYSNATGYCKDRRAMLIVDPPNNWTNKDLAKNNIDRLNLRDENAVIYFPSIRAPDPLAESRLRKFAPSGAVAGIMAKTDAQRGVWKAPAGIDAILTGVPELELKLTDPENGELNPLGINCLRVMPATGRVVWGARTMKGADRLANQWKYLPVRRTALYIEETLYRGTQWVVFEPNDEPLWSQIRLNVGAFMHDLFTQGAFQGSTPKEAYLVKCDKETTTQYDIDRGIVNILVGFAPLKPAEFVIIKIQQLAGQTEVQQ